MALYLQLWQTYELMVEIAIMRELRLSIEQTSIVCGSLAYAAKSAILLGLLKKNGTKADAISALRTAQQLAERNDFYAQLFDPFTRGTFDAPR
jgi:hypothetical protein